MGHFLKKVAKYALPIAGAALGSAVPGIGTALGASLGAGAGSLASGGGIKGALLSGLGTYAGSSIGSSLFGGLGTVGSQFGGSAANAVGPSFINPGLGGLIGSAANGNLGGALANTSLGSIAGGFAGNAYGASQAAQGPAAPAGPAAFKPSQSAQANLPDSLQGFGSLNPLQQSTNIANQGVYGGGEGPQENSYFLNLINRRLVDPSGKTSDQSNLQPIEQSYLQKLGLGGYNNSNSLLEAISKWQPA